MIEPDDNRLICPDSTDDAEIKRLHKRVQEAEIKQLLDQRQCDEMTDHAAILAKRVAELESIPNWMADYFDIHGHLPTTNHIREQFNIK